MAQPLPAVISAGGASVPHRKQVRPIVRWSGFSRGLKALYSEVVCVDEPRFLQALEEVAALLGQNSQAPFLVRFHLGHLNNEACIFSSLWILRLGQNFQTNKVLLRNVGLPQVSEDFLVLVHSIPLYPGQALAHYADVCFVASTRKPLVRAGAAAYSAPVSHKLSTIPSLVVPATRPRWRAMRSVTAQ